MRGKFFNFPLAATAVNEAANSPRGINNNNRHVAISWQFAPKLSQFHSSFQFCQPAGLVPEPQGQVAQGGAPQGRAAEAGKWREQQLPG